MDLNEKLKGGIINILKWAILYTRYESYFLRNPLKKSPLFPPCIKNFGRFGTFAKPTYPKRRT